MEQQHVRCEKVAFHTCESCFVFQILSSDIIQLPLSIVCYILHPFNGGLEEYKSRLFSEISNVDHACDMTPFIKVGWYL